jgi:hypothetical protein
MIMSASIPQDLRKTVWKAMLGADLNYCYYSRLSCRYSNWDKWAKVFLAVTSSSTVATWALWSNAQLLWQVLSGISALLAVILPVLNWRGIIEKAAGASGGWFQLMNQYENLWLAIQGGIMKTQETYAEYQKISAKERELVDMVVGFPEVSSLIERCDNQVRASRS